MALPRCPSCAAPFEERQTDPLVRCTYCGGLLVVSAGHRQPFEAPPRLSADETRALVGRDPAILRAGLRAIDAELFFYPFEMTGNARRPLVPRSDLPPLLAETWRATGADLLAAKTDDTQSFDGIRAPITMETSGRVLFYPFFRVRLAGPRSETACWVDAIDSQIFSPVAEAADSIGGSPLSQWWQIAGGVGIAIALLFPSTLAVLTTVAAAGAILWGASRWA